MIAIKDLSKSFGNLKVLDNLNFKINDGDLIAIYGPNGCGKTTLLNCLAGIMDYQGQILINDKPPSNSKISMVFQSYSDSLFPWRTVLENVVFPLEVKKVLQSKNIARRALKNTLLSRYLHYYPYQLSGGMQQLVSIARAFVYRPDVILLDEPFSSLDNFVKKQIRDELIKLWKQTKLTTIFVTHDLDEAVLLANKIIVLSQKPSKVINIVNISEFKDNHKDFLHSKKFMELKNEILKKIR